MTDYSIFLEMQHGGNRHCAARLLCLIVITSYSIHYTKLYDPGGVDLKRFRPFDQRKEIKSDLVLPKNKIDLLTVRNLEPRMGVDNLIKSIKIINSSP